MTDKFRPTRHIKYHPRFTRTQDGLTLCELIRMDRILAYAYGGNRKNALIVTADILDDKFDDEIERSMP